MGRLAFGSLIAAVAMFLLGFLFYGSPLFNVARVDIPADTQLAVHAALQALPKTGFYAVPFAESGDAALVAAHAAGPIATIHLTKPGSPVMDPSIMIAGFLHMFVSAFLLGYILWAMRGRLGEFDGRMKLVALIAFATTVYFNIGKAVWWPGGWTFNLYVAVADFTMLLAAGFIIARWFMPRSAS
jgi:hypothetical protein